MAVIVPATNGAMHSLPSLLSALPDPGATLLRETTAAALAHGFQPYLVGGSVRDLLLGQPSIDLDVVIVGPALTVATALHQRLPTTTLHAHQAFGTATVTLREGASIDLITARQEVYPHPGALPVITPSTLDDDLRRRDFTINAMALTLAPERYGALIDPLDGQADLRQRQIRVLHPASFHDDPTRLLRAARYAARLTSTGAVDSAIEATTARLFREAVAARALGAISIQRAMHELLRLLDEPRAAAALDYLASSGALQQIVPAARWDNEIWSALSRLDGLWVLATAPDVPRATARLALLLAHLAPPAAEEAAAALHLPASAIRCCADTAAARAALQGLPGDLPNSALGERLDPFSPVALIAAASLLDDTARAAVARYLDTIAPVRPLLDGNALRALGLPPGPHYRAALAALLSFRRDHPDRADPDEWSFLRDWLNARGLL